MDIMALEFPKQVEIVNQRLSILYYVCMGAMVAFAITLFFVFEQYAKQVSLAGHVQVNMWPIGFAGVIYEKFSIVEEVAGMATRLMSNSVAFVDLKDTGDQRAAGISQRKMRERLGESLKHRGEKLDRNEMDSFVDFCYRAVATNNVQKKRRSSRSLLFGSSRSGDSEDAQEAEYINIDSFSKACSSLDKIRFEAVVKLFDRDRRVRLLERLFMPQYMLKYLSDVDNARSSMSEVNADLEKGACPRSISSSIFDLDQSPGQSVRRRASESSIQSQFSICDSLGFEKVHKLEDASCTSKSACSQPQESQPSMERIKSFELCQQLERYSELCQKIADGTSLTVEQKKNLPQFTLQALSDVITRALTINDKLRNDERKLEEIQCEVKEAKEIASLQLLGEVSVIEKQVKDNTLGQEHLLKEFAERSKEIDEAKSELGKLQAQCGPLSTLLGTIESLQQELGNTKDAMQACKEELATLKEKTFRHEVSGDATFDSNILVASDKSIGLRMMPACIYRKTPKHATPS